MYVNKLVKFIVQFSGITAVSILVSAVVIKGEFAVGIFKLTYQFALLVVMGGAVGWVFRSYTKIREGLESDRQELLGATRDLVSSYNDIKAIRRILRAQAQKCGEIGEPETYIQIDVYERQVLKLSRVQLTLEAYKRRVNADKQLFKEAAGLHRRLSEMEVYLHCVIEEYELAFREFSEKPTSLLAIELPKLSEFIAPRMESNAIKENILFAFHGALDTLTIANAKARRDSWRI